jgi:hypothetical protein
MKSGILRELEGVGSFLIQYPHTASMLLFSHTFPVSFLYFVHNLFYRNYHFTQFSSVSINRITPQVFFSFYSVIAQTEH